MDIEIISLEAISGIKLKLHRIDLNISTTYNMLLPYLAFVSRCYSLPRSLSDL